MSRSLAQVFAAGAFVVSGLSGAAHANKVVTGADVSGPVQGVLVTAYADTTLSSEALLYAAPAKAIGQMAP
ncbi:MAG TPA: hypothetical protein VGH80_07685 [Xanthomonadaceae bacterium]|jgi:hypothetical protein